MLAGMSIKHSIVINRPILDVFNIYKDVDSWAVWDPDVEAVALDGPFAAGSTGWLKPVGAPKTKTRMVSVVEPREFTVEAKLPLCVMSFGHQLMEVSGSTTVMHTVDFTGILAPIFSRLVGRKIEAGIDGTLHGLKRYAEAQ